MFRMRSRGASRALSEFANQCFSVLVDILRDPQLDRNDEITLPAARHGQATATKSKNPAILCSRRDAHSLVWCGRYSHRHAGPEDGLRGRNPHCAVKVRAPTLEVRVSLYVTGDHEIARGSSLRPVVTEPWKAYDLTVHNTRWSLYRYCLGAAGET